MNLELFYLLRNNFKILEKTDNQISVSVLNNNRQTNISAPHILVAVGVKGVIDGLGLDSIGVNIKSNSIIIDENCETNVKGIYAIGDVTTVPCLAHKASHQGIIVAEKISGKKVNKFLKDEDIPSCTYSNPQIASIGLTEEKAKQQGYDVNIGNFPFIANGKALAMGEDEGFIKTIFDKNTGELLGAHLVGAEVTELISSYIVGKGLETTPDEFLSNIFPHPTMSEMLYESVLSSESKAIHY